MLDPQTSLDSIFFPIPFFHGLNRPGSMSIHTIVGKKWDPGILDPSQFSGQIRKVEARLGKLAKIRKLETD